MGNIRKFGALALVGLSIAGAHGQELTGTLKKIHDNGVIVLGTRESSIPFSYYDANQNVVGYSQEIALKIVDAVKQKLGAPELRVKTIPITSQNRIPLVQNGTIDIECGSTTNTFERENQAAFSNSFFLYGIRFITRKDSGVKDFADLAGKTVATTAGTSDERLLRKMNEEKHMNMTIISAKDHAESFMNVTTGRAVAFVMDEPLLYGERAKSKDAADYVVTGTPPVSENYACMFRREDPEFKALVDDTIARMQTSGEMAKLYAKWFTQPIPPNGMNLQYPLSAEMKDLFAHPNDKALD
ncbi:glutamate/aspartate ABC transporter substrate-binding protein [Paraburkholderia caballeronis]|uniref:Amino acid ABC transporter substrate-binding protein, PAAT family n=1 Tax=Paraburkholderia caballeronis TaxID=416943 RepID=A0A1H7V6U7_9BURK|nr:glutamate/aspartate ABC transporter substrate-binding protein [Paraburkholderia caballeronis]PXW16442.1 amino acid ABC transporter substrate-binding protein (PAAT family) [Paraburkholderia caballeronis]PXW94281.1 amino acid ABC transporter substrate-binding protein (PAAT family) [Paraburkholderia caballeronis]RAJ89692.1 amino acid ABC transporter substrate-binding protein (PAAT family) [Paraburkholderia caballeronis]TDV09242.1 amino acid ABC transporter substrate-binding protein (PAAT family